MCTQNSVIILALFKVYIPIILFNVLFTFTKVYIQIFMNIGT